MVPCSNLWVFKVKWSVYKAYLCAMGYASFLLCLLLMILSNFLGVGANMWLAKWCDAKRQYLINQTSDERKNTDTFYLSIYTVLGMLHCE